MKGRKVQEALRARQKAFEDGGGKGFGAGRRRPGSQNRKKSGYGANGKRR